ncbi:MAG: RNA methyltransferase [Deltaproteobacteria bacterium]|nr:RNA methyltransferase [Nannocystaceae bacterium]
MPLSIALLHHPVLNRIGEEITSTVDHFDVMDGSRLTRTYGVQRFYVVNHVPAQQALVERLIRHGTAGDGREARGEFAHTLWAPDLASVVADETRVLGRRPTVIATTAGQSPDAVGFATLRGRLIGGEPMLVLFGKAWGLSTNALASADVRLAPIDGGTGFNHLSVRSAMAIIVDRLLG